MGVNCVNMHRMFTKLTALTLVAVSLTTVTATAHAQEPATMTDQTWRVVGTGDSILGMALGVPAPGGTSLTADRWLNLEYGRNAYAAGMLGADGSSTEAVAMMAIARSQPGGWIIVEDNSLGVSDYGWQALMEKIVDATPSDRCLLGVLPAFRADVNAENAAIVRAHTVVMANEFRRHPCRRFVYMADIMNRFPDDFTDGQHPRTAAAQQAIRAAIRV